MNNTGRDRRLEFDWNTAATCGIPAATRILPLQTIVTSMPQIHWWHWGTPAPTSSTTTTTANNRELRSKESSSPSWTLKGTLNAVPQGCSVKSWRQIVELFIHSVFCFYRYQNSSEILWGSQADFKTSCQLNCIHTGPDHKQSGIKLTWGLKKWKEWLDLANRSKKYNNPNLGNQFGLLSYCLLKSSRIAAKALKCIYGMRLQRISVPPVYDCDWRLSQAYLWDQWSAAYERWLPAGRRELISGFVENHGKQITTCCCFRNIKCYLSFFAPKLRFLWLWKCRKCMTSGKNHTHEDLYFRGKGLYCVWRRCRDTQIVLDSGQLWAAFSMVQILGTFSIY